MARKIKISIRATVPKSLKTTAQGTKNATSISKIKKSMANK
jgi:hypothetical protein